MRFGQSAADADTLTRARPLAPSTESVSCHTEENLGVDAPQLHADHAIEPARRESMEVDFPRAARRRRG
jgi:hypothetical protein